MFNMIFLCSNNIQLVASGKDSGFIITIQDGITGKTVKAVLTGVEFGFLLALMAGGDDAVIPASIPPAIKAHLDSLFIDKPEVRPYP